MASLSVDLVSTGPQVQEVSKGLQVQVAQVDNQIRKFLKARRRLPLPACRGLSVLARSGPQVLARRGLLVLLTQGLQVEVACRGRPAQDPSGQPMLPALVTRADICNGLPVLRARVVQEDICKGRPVQEPHQEVIKAFVMYIMRA
mmetsp:Transcript_26415/g.47640  ORF Transcript_26415/g.47640 Transcript_26415/m.47640 type:complete len:145 (-) Transcript_26415:298-732(-)